MSKIYVAVICSFDVYEFNNNVFVSNDLQKVYKFLEGDRFKELEICLSSDEDRRIELANKESTFIDIEEWDILTTTNKKYREKM